VEKKELRELMEFISNSNFVEFELEREGFKLKLVKEAARAPVVAATAAAAPPAPPAPAWEAPVAPTGGRAPSPAVAADSSGDIFQVTSPMVGTFYRAPNPTVAPYVQVGDVVKKGQVICIIEAMKLMNEIESEVAGEIIDVPVSNGQPVEYGEVLFRIRAIPS